MANKEECLLLMVLLQAIDLQLTDLEEEHDSLLIRHIHEQRRLNRSLPAEKKRVSWDHFITTIADLHFRGMFRMDLPVFNKLCLLVSE